MIAWILGLIFLYSSTPGSTSFGKHMTSEEVIEFFAPAQSSVDAVISWLVGYGIAPARISQSANKQVSTREYGIICLFVPSIPF